MNRRRQTCEPGWGMRKMSIEKLLNQPFTPWMTGGECESDIVLSSRIRLARNLDGVPFPNRASGSQLAAVVNEMEKSVEDIQKAGQRECMFIKLDELLPLARCVLVEKHVISPNHAAQPENRALIVGEDTAISIMVNEEDHLRIQCMAPGLDLTSVLETANNIDDVLEARCDFGFNEQMGYLTACPTNLGTGLRASVMLHLPALVLSKQINRIVNAATQLGLAVRGLYGEGTEAVGNVFQISNQLTLGYTEQEIIDNLYSVVRQIVAHERNARQILLNESMDTLSDRVWRSFGILRYARSINGQEALSMLSEVRLGMDLGIINEAPAGVFNELLVAARPNFLQNQAGGKEMEAAERDRLRAEMIRSKMNGGGISC